MPRVTGSWTGISSPVRDYSSTESYGYVYSSGAVVDSRGVCPEGWKVASRDDYINLLASIGSYNAYNLRSCRQVGSPLGGECATSILPRWNSSANYGTDDLGFSLLPGGYKYSSSQWPYIGDGYHLWTSTPNGSSLYEVSNTGGDTISTAGSFPVNSAYGLYIRCIKE
ncbi:hypothetical protein CVU82_01450 [Candidatus Falkowbacteria bacterium HGW-Falkowbacteria-1]|uniref:Fibrobacter succinogenes major paralogous domain-containing protein n=1 Tax=Candidatus Falkowbacteria bacterium HGW-Falkowbacteria-1 TaxID=2013768 RepID=A0A2N2E952_9BACT|nr:MAG: hypothetical protein CVU82_01450 [Candidatus Falkowbacteria bacterium HGW-Falkowbacteria-1]